MLLMVTSIGASLVLFTSYLPSFSLYPFTHASLSSCFGCLMSNRGESYRHSMCLVVDASQFGAAACAACSLVRAQMTFAGPTAAMACAARQATTFK